MSHLTSFESQTNAHLVAASEETECMVDLSFEVVSVNTAGQLNFLYFHSGLLFLSVLFLFVALITVLTVIHCAAYGRSSLRCDTNKVYALFVRIFLSLVEALDTELVTVLIKKTDFLCADIVIDKKLFCAYSEAPPKSLIGNKKVRNNTPHKTPLFGETFCIKPMLALAVR